MLVRSVIALHGGSLRYESEPGKGTTVRATLPSCAQAQRRGLALAACSTDSLMSSG
jgi:two-component system, NtrC family, sensor histidine kinase HydH